MMPATRRYFARVVLLALLCAPAIVPVRADQPQPFDWSLLDGHWAESTRHQFACRPDNVHFRIVVSPDRRRLTFKLDRPTDLGGGKEVREYGAEIRRAESHSIFLRYDKENVYLVAADGEWELRFLGPGVYRTGFTGWDKGTYNNVVGVRCGS